MTNESTQPVVMWWDGGERAITACEKALIEEHRPSCFTIPLLAGSAWSLDAASYGSALNEAAWVFIDQCPEKSALLFNSIKVVLRAAILRYAELVPGDRAFPAPDANESHAALKEVSEDERARFEAWARPRFPEAEVFDRIHGRPGGWEYNGNYVQAAWAGWQAALAATGKQHVGGVPDCVWEALQRIIENSALHGPASNEDAILVARYRRDLLASRQPAGQAPGARIEDYGSSICAAVNARLRELDWDVADEDLHDAVEIAVRTTPIPASPAQGIDLGAGVRAIADERRRQVEIERFSPATDAEYSKGELAKAALAYVQLAAMDLAAGGRDHIATGSPPACWPWHRLWWKPRDARRDLVRAGALIAAQLDVIDTARDAAPEVACG